MPFIDTGKLPVVERRTAGPGFVGIVPPDTPHSVKAISNGKAIIVDYPLRDQG